MMKSVVLAFGVFACVVGAELLLIDSATVRPLDGAGQPRTVTAPDWAPWALISAGAVTILHLCTGSGAAAGTSGQGAKLPPGRFGHF